MLDVVGDLVEGKDQGACGGSFTGGLGTARHCCAVVGYGWFWHEGTWRSEVGGHSGRK